MNHEPARAPAPAVILRAFKTTEGSGPLLVERPKSFASMPRMASLVLALSAAILSVAAAPATRPARPLKIVDSLMKGQSSSRPTTVPVDHVVLHFCSDVIQHPDHPYDVDRIKEIFAKPRPPPTTSSTATAPSTASSPRTAPPGTPAAARSPGTSPSRA